MVKTILKSQNKDWGFYGTAKGYLKNSDDISELWSKVSVAIMAIGKLTPTEARLLLDSRWGRHIADQYAKEIKTGIDEFILAFDTTKAKLKKDFIHFVVDVYGQEETANEAFCRELADLSKKYGIVIQAVGGVIQDINNFKGYDTDLGSGDLMPIWE